MIKESVAYKYCEWALVDEKAPIYVKKQCNMWKNIADGNDTEAYVCEKSYKKINKLLKIITHPDLHCSMYEGLEKYSQLLITAVLCTKDRKTNNRYYTTALLKIARKNFKTFRRYKKRMGFFQPILPC